MRRLVIVPMLAGMGPVRSLPARSKTKRLVRLLRSDGNEPVKVFCPPSMTMARSREPNDAGNCPLKRLLRK